ncbi:MAG: hypothetical protein P8X55_19115 [Desulfosarcinaceae bacterium]|jgi:hypothetical protein
MQIYPDEQSPLTMLTYLLRQHKICVVDEQSAVSLNRMAYALLQAAQWRKSFYLQAEMEDERAERGSFINY